MWKVFDYIIEFDFDPEKVDWPFTGLDDEANPVELFANMEFFPFREISTNEAHMVTTIEDRQLQRIHSGELKFSEIQNADEEAIENHDANFWEQPWRHLDFGVRGAVMSMTSIGATTITCCNGGSFESLGDDKPHREDYPLILFTGDHHHIRLVEEAARCNNCGLVGAEETYPKSLVVYTNDIQNFTRFSYDLLELYQN